MPDDDLKTVELIQASISSFDNETADFNLPRVIPITILVDAGGNTDLGIQVEHETRKLLERFGYNVTHVWGPFEGSRFITIFGSSRQFEDGDTFTEKVHAIAQEVASGLWKRDWKSSLANAGDAIKIAVAVGGIVTVIVVGPASITLGSFVVPAKVLAILQGAGHTVNIITSAKKLFFDSKQSATALDQGQASEHPVSSEVSVVLERDLKVSRPLRLKKS